MSNLHLWSRVQEAKRRGAKIVAIDPYRSLSAEKCTQHVALRPGTDGMLALGMMHVLIAEDLLDHDYIAKHTLGFWMTSEDLPDPENRVTLERDGRIRLSYAPNNEEAHVRLTKRLKSMLRGIGCEEHLHPMNVYIGKRIPLASVAPRSLLL